MPSLLPRTLQVSICNETPFGIVVSEWVALAQPIQALAFKRMKPLVDRHIFSGGLARRFCFGLKRDGVFSPHAVQPTSSKAATKHYAHYMRAARGATSAPQTASTPSQSSHQRGARG